MSQKNDIGPPLPHPDPLTQFFWDGVANHKLIILRCQQCGHYIHWPRPVCRFCLSLDLSPREMSGRGTLYSWTVALQPFQPWFADKIPYIVATIELDEEPGLKMVSNMVDCTEDDLRIDLPVEVTFHELAPGFTLPLFRPAGA
jgi:uncharacterized OB-fold protein